MFYECEVDSFDTAVPDDDAEEIIVSTPGEIDPEEFGLTSVKEGVKRYVSK
jgi:hypothetical protein